MSSVLPLSVDACLPSGLSCVIGISPGPGFPHARAVTLMGRDGHPARDLSKKLAIENLEVQPPLTMLFYITLMQEGDYSLSPRPGQHRAGLQIINRSNRPYYGGLCSSRTVEMIFWEGVLLP